MEAAFTRFRVAIAIVATIVVGTASIQAIAQAGEPAQSPVWCPPHC